MMLYSLPCLLEEDNCRFQTIQLEFSQSKEILEMHMTLVHGRPEWRSKCDSCDRDTLVNDDKVKDIFDNDKRALLDKVEEASFGFTNELNMKDDPKDSKTETVQNMEAAEVTSVIDDRDDVTEHKKDDSTVDYSITENEALQHSEVAEVTSVDDDRDEVNEHFNDEGYDKQEAENVAVNEIFKPVGVLQPSALCRNCGESNHTSERRVRRKHCSAWNSYCGACNKRGHYRSVCKSIQIPSGGFDFGELAALSYLSRVSNDLKPITKLKVPHMVFDQLRWIISNPQIAT